MYPLWKFAAVCYSTTLGLNTIGGIMVGSGWNTFEKRLKNGFDSSKLSKHGRK